MVRGQKFLQADFVSHVVDGLLKQLEALAAGRAGLHGAGQVELLQEQLQLLVQGKVLPVGRHQQTVH